MEVLKVMCKAFTACRSLAMSIQRMNEESLSDTSTRQSPSEYERSSHSDKNELVNEKREVLTHQLGTMVTRHYRDSSLYSSCNATYCDLEEN